MILGTFSVEGKQSSLFEIVRRNTDHAGLTFSFVTAAGFNGGFYCSQGLPYKADDFYWSDESSDLNVLLSGTVYNIAELIKKTGNNAPCTYPELIGRLYLRYGPDFVGFLNGDFAILIIQTSKKLAYLFRDHAGIRPLAFSVVKGNLIFSSDIIGLSRALSDDKRPESEYLLGSFKYIDYRRTPEKKVKKLLPGHFLKFSVRGTEIIRYWNPGRIRENRGLKYEQMLDDLRALVSDAVRIRCDNRFNAGSHVSSGIDSGVVSALARKEYLHQKDFYGFSWSPECFTATGVKYDERDLVRSSCSFTDIKPVFSEMNSVSFLKHLTGFYNNQGHFYEEACIEEYVRLKVNLIFSGWGGDEFISTADRGIELDLLRRLRFRTFFRRNPVRPLKKFIKNQLLYVFYPAAGILDPATARSFDNDAYYIKEPFKESNRAAIRNFYFHKSRHQLHLRLFDFYHLQERCESWAVNGYRNGIEYRFPLLDKRIIEYMLTVPSELLCKTDDFRPLLRELGRGLLPEDVRLNCSKRDPVFWVYFNELYRLSAVSIMEEMSLLSNNPDLNFINFNLLEEDSLKYRQNPEGVNTKVLFRALVYLKAVHEFTKSYRNPV